MGKKVPYKIARLMYDLQEYCATNLWEKKKPCEGCPANKRKGCNLFVACYGIPKMWGITKAELERLERGEDDLEEAR